jgi:septal ring factor EnvC (AmiA/AmiB activator)
MSLRFLAEELYRLTRKVEDLEKTLAALEVETDIQERNRLEMELLKARKELAHMRAVLDSKKEPSKI